MFDADTVNTDATNVHANTVDKKRRWVNRSALVTAMLEGQTYQV
jgi:hypothetical protein